MRRFTLLLIVLVAAPTAALVTYPLAGRANPPALRPRGGFANSVCSEIFAMAKKGVKPDAGLLRQVKVAVGDFNSSACVGRVLREGIGPSDVASTRHSSLSSTLTSVAQLQGILATRVSCRRSLLRSARNCTGLERARFCGFRGTWMAPFSSGRRRIRLCRSS